jgi:hypothetical protein
MYINAVAKKVVTVVVTLFYNIIIKIRHKLSTDSGSAACPN